MASIDSPCHEAWSRMREAPGGRFCDRCDFTVIDVTAMPHGQAQQFLDHDLPAALAAGRRQCVRALADRRGVLLRPGWRRLTNGMAAILAMSLVGCGSGVAQPVSNQDPPPTAPTRGDPESGPGPHSSDASDPVPWPEPTIIRTQPFSIRDGLAKPDSIVIEETIDFGRAVGLPVMGEVMCPEQRKSPPPTPSPVPLEPEPTAAPPLPQAKT